jgi:alpha-tubulin suppressor-like RCC1 family protein
MMQSEEAGSVLAAACGSNHSVLLTESGAVYTAGCNSSGQCGQDSELKQVSDE